MPTWRRFIGNAAEKRAAKEVKRNGLRLLAYQYRTKYGEIDLIARDGDEVVFIEVKARHSDAFGSPQEAVTQKKLERIWRVGMQFLRDRQLEQSQVRIDVIAIRLDTGELDWIRGVEI